MYLSNGNDFIDIRVVGYEFPNITGHGTKLDFDYDANWLNLYCNKNIDGIKKFGIEPCILTTDIAKIINLFSDYQTEKINRIDFGGLEPNFEFHLIRGEQWHKLDILFWAESTGEPYDKVKKFSKIIDNGEFEYIKAFWKKTLKHFPER